MERQTYIKINRAFFDSPFWNETRPKTKAEAYIDLFQMAIVERSNYSTPDFHTTIELYRGEGVWSIRFLAKRWKWSRGKVEIFFNILKRRGKITQTVRGATDTAIQQEVKKDGVKTPLQKNDENPRQQTRQGIMVTFLNDYNGSQSNELYQKRHQTRQGQDTPPAFSRQIQEEEEVKNNTNIYSPLFSEEENTIEQGNEIEPEKKPEKDVFDYWNTKKTVVHRDLSKFSPSINESLKHYTPEEIKTAMDNYALVLKDKKYYWSHSWTLDQFLRQKNALDKFLPDNFKEEEFYCPEYREYLKTKPTSNIA